MGHLRFCGERGDQPSRPYARREGLALAAKARRWGGDEGPGQRRGVAGSRAGRRTSAGLAGMTPVLPPGARTSWDSFRTLRLVRVGRAG